MPLDSFQLETVVIF